MKKLINLIDRVIFKLKNYLDEYRIISKQDKIGFIQNIEFTPSNSNQYRFEGVFLKNESGPSFYIMGDNKEIKNQKDEINKICLGE